MTTIFVWFKQAVWRKNTYNDILKEVKSAIHWEFCCFSCSTRNIKSVGFYDLVKTEELLKHMSDPYMLKEN